jgi:hypothetical protein
MLDSTEATVPYEKRYGRIGYRAIAVCVVYIYRVSSMLRTVV